MRKPVRNGSILLAGIAAVFLVSQSAGFSFSTTTDVDDDQDRTEGKLQTDIAFIDDNLSVNGGTPFHTWNLTNVTGTAGTGDEKLKANVSQEGRHFVRNESSGTVYKVDLVEERANITGRLKSTTNIATDNLVLKYWLNNSKVDTSSNAVNITGPSSWQLGEYIYRANSSNQNRFWVGLESDTYGDVYTGSGGDYENKVADFPVLSKPSNVSGRIVFENGTAVSGLKVRVAASSTANFFDTFPYIDRPPIKTDFTGSNGHFNFTDLQVSSGGLGYSVEVVNSSHSRTNSTPFGNDFSLEVANAENHTGDYVVSPDVGGINATIDAPEADRVRYGMLAGNRETGKGYLEPVDVSQTNYYFGDLPNGTYTVVMYRLDDRGGSLFPDFDSDRKTDVEVQKGQNTTLSFKFEEKVLFSGTVTNSTGSPISNARIVAKNRTDFDYTSTSTDSNGEYTVRLTNNTRYEITANPPFFGGDDLTSNNTELEVNAANTAKNFTLSEGVVLNGTILGEDGNPVSSGFVTVTNTSEGAYKFDSVDSNGNYRIEGLRKNIRYNIDAESFDGGQNFTEISGISSGFKTRNFTVGVQRASITGYVKSGGNAENATLKLYSRGSLLNSTENDNSGYYNFSGLEQGQFLRLEVEPDSSGFEPETKYTYLTGSDEINFSLSSKGGLNGKVVDGSGDGIPGVSVYARNQTVNSEGWERTDSNGEYNITGLKQEPHDITYTKEGYKPTTSNKDVNSFDTTVGDVTLNTGENITGSILTDGQKISLNGSIAFSNSSKESSGYSEITSGDFSVDGLKDVRHEAWVSVDSGKYSPKTFDVKKPSSLVDGFRKNFTVDTNDGKELKVTVENSTGTVEDAKVATGSLENRTDDDGVARFPEQPVGEVTLTASKEGYEGVQKTINVSTPSSSNLGGSVREETLNIERIDEKKLDVNVTKNSKSGEAVSGATVLFVSNQTGVSKSGSSVTGSTGKATVEHLSTGDYGVTLGTGEGNTDTNSVTINADESSFVQFSISSKTYYLGYQVNPQ